MLKSVEKAEPLEKAITGETVTVMLCGTERRLQYRFAAVIAYQQATVSKENPDGDSLFDREKFKKIDLRRDPKRWLACLWAGLHEEQPDPENPGNSIWKSPLTLAELSGLIDFDAAQVGEIMSAMAKALAAHLPKTKVADPKAEPAPEENAKSYPTSASSGLEPVDDTPLPALSS